MYRTEDKGINRLYYHEHMSTFECQRDFWIPAVVTFFVVVISISIVSKIDKKKILLLTLLPARVIILGVLWSGSPNSESVQLDLSFTEVSVGAGFLLLVKNFIEDDFKQNTTHK